MLEFADGDVLARDGGMRERNAKEGDQETWKRFSGERHNVDSSLSRISSLFFLKTECHVFSRSRNLDTSILKTFLILQPPRKAKVTRIFWNGDATELVCRRSREFCEVKPSSWYAAEADAQYWIEFGRSWQGYLSDSSVNCNIPEERRRARTWSHSSAKI